MNTIIIILKLDNEICFNTDTNTHTDIYLMQLAKDP